MTAAGDPPTPDSATHLRALFDRLRAGDEAALEALFRAEYARLCAFADAIIHAPDVAEEIVQGVFVAIWSNRALTATPDNVRAYLVRAVRNHALNHIARMRTEQRHAPAIAEEQRSAAAAESALEDLERADSAQAIHAALEALPSRCRQVMVLRWQHGLRNREIADALGITLKAVEQHLSRGLSTLRTHFSSPAREER